MTRENRRIIEAASELLGRDRQLMIERVAECNDGVWYLKEKIIKAPDVDTRLDNTRVLKYAYNFDRSGGEVTFVREERGPTPDLRVVAVDRTFFVEVRKFRMPEGDPSRHPVEKIISAVEDKRHQLPNSAIGYVAIDNFDIHLEPSFSYDVIHDAICEMQRRASENPNGWRVPGGVIVAASTWMGSTLPVKLPHFVWTNPAAEPTPPTGLTAWIVSALPDGQMFHCTETELEASDEVDRHTPVESLEF